MESADALVRLVELLRDAADISQEVDDFDVYDTPESQAVFAHLVKQEDAAYIALIEHCRDHAAPLIAKLSRDELPQAPGGTSDP